MERKLASIQRIESLTPIEGADRIVKARVMGWDTIVRKDEFNEGDECVFFEIDSVLPSDNPDFAFMERSKFRVKTMRMRGVLSQGLAMPINILIHLNCGKELNEFEVGDDVTFYLGVEKYEVPEVTTTGMKGARPLDAHPFPHYVPRTDEIRIQSAPEILNEIVGIPVCVTVKLDGTSATYVHRNGEFSVCSRKLSWDRNKSVYWEIADRYDLEKKLPLLGNIAIQGELCGPGIQKNRMGLKKVNFFVFDVWDIDKQEYYNYHDLQVILKQLELKPVPLVFGAVSTLEFDLDTALIYAEGTYADCKGYDFVDHPREGIVIRPIIERYSPTLKGRLSFKVVNNKYLLKTGE